MMIVVSIEDRIADLRERASRAFDAAFRAKLADACQVIGDRKGWTVMPGDKREKCGRPDVCCPEGALLAVHGKLTFRYPWPDEIGFGHDGAKHLAFQEAFDDGKDNGTPEAALGFLYRERFLR